MTPLPDTSMGGYVAPPPEVEHVVQVGFFSVWLTRNTLLHNGVEGKLLYVHHHSLWIVRWLFGYSDCLQDRKWKTVEKFTRDAQRAFDRKVAAYLKEQALVKDLNQLAGAPNE